MRLRVLEVAITATFGRSVGWLAGTPGFVGRCGHPLTCMYLYAYMAKPFRLRRQFSFLDFMPTLPPLIVLNRNVFICGFM